MLKDGDKLIVDGREISFVYCLSGFIPDYYTSQDIWDVRETLEWSRACKAPSVPAQLAGTKKVQQMWCKESVLKRFMPQKDQAKNIEDVLSVFAVQAYPVEKDKQTKKWVEDAIAHKDAWLLKPQREGGGHLVSGDKVRELLEEGDEQKLGEFVLMQKIMPFPQPSGMLSPTLGFTEHNETVSELGIFQTLVYNGERRVTNEAEEACGHLMKTKKAASPEGGVMSGNAVLDTALLVEKM